jgi:hypothetical protein
MCSLRLGNPTYVAVLLVAVLYEFTVNRVGVPSVCDVPYRREMWCDAH